MAKDIPTPAELGTIAIMRNNAIVDAYVEEMVTKLREEFTPGRKMFGSFKEPPNGFVEGELVDRFRKKGWKLTVHGPDHGSPSCRYTLEPQPPADPYSRTPYD